MFGNYRWIPSMRWALPPCGHSDNLRGAVVFLASESSNYMHGFTMAVDGDWLAR